MAATGKPWTFGAGLIFVGIGVLIVVAGSALSNVGTAVDNLIASKWTGYVLAAFGIFLLFGASKKGVL